MNFFSIAYTVGKLMLLLTFVSFNSNKTSKVKVLSTVIGFACFFLWSILSYKLNYSSNAITVMIHNIIEICHLK